MRKCDFGWRDFTAAPALFTGITIRCLDSLVFLAGRKVCEVSKMSLNTNTCACTMTERHFFPRSVKELGDTDDSVCKRRRSTAAWWCQAVSGKSGKCISLQAFFPLTFYCYTLWINTVYTQESSSEMLSRFQRQTFSLCVGMAQRCSIYCTVLCFEHMNMHINKQAFFSECIIYCPPTLEFLI